MYKSISICFLLAFSLIIKAQDTTKTDATLKSAVVYFGHGAELTHQAKVPVNSNTRQIIINQIATNIDINSLQISVPENVALLSQKFQLYTPTVPVVVNPMIKKWNDSILILNKETGRLNNLIDIEQQTLDKTGRLIEITINSTTVKTITSDETLKLINAYTAKIEKSKLAIFKFNEDKAAVQERIQQFYAKIQEAQNVPVAPVKTTGQLILQVLCKSSGDIPISLSYFTNYAGFTPMYDVRVNSKTNEIKLVYKASVSQNTGINWKQVKLTLSTANPTWGGVAPLLNAWYLQLYVPQLYSANLNNAPMVSNTIQSYGLTKRDAEVIAADDVAVNGYSKKSLGLATQTIDPSNLANFTTLSESQLNTNFEIDLPYDINSDGEIQSVTIKEEKLKASLKNYAVPKLDRDAYLLAEIADWQNLNLLPGAANIIMDDTYIGKSVIDPNITADTMNLSLGRDKRLAVKRNIVKEFTTTKNNGSTVKQTFTYELVVKNNKTTKMNLLLKDQYPLSLVKEVEVNLERSDDAMINPETGILTWKIELAPGESKKVRFSYTVKYPSEKRIANL
ncbi:MAG: hypothetical protein RLY16_617 [Bacteroidota bacterium]